jgi:hypothetical protein
MGTLDYMAPEQGGDSHQVDIRADLYSLGATLYKLLAGEAPFCGEKYDSPMKKLTALATEPPRPLRSLRPDAPQGVVAIVHKLLEKDPARRFATPGELAAALAPHSRDANLAALSDHDIRPAKPLDPTRTEPRAGVARHETTRRLFVVAAACALALVVLGVVLYLQTPKGVIQLEINDPSIEVRIDNEGARLRGVDRKHEIKLKPGEHGLTITRGELTFHTDKFVLKKGKKTRLVVQWLPGKVEVDKDGQLFWLENVATPPSTPTSPPPAVASGHSAVRFGSEGARLAFPSLRFSSSGPWTVEAWVTVRKPLLEKGGESALIFRVAEAALVVRHLGGRGVKWSVGGPSTKPPPSVESTEAVTVDLPVHVAMERGPEGVSFYLDGVRQGDPVTIVDSRRETTLDVCQPDSKWHRFAFHGDLDEIRVSSVARYRENFTPQLRFEPDDDTLALYHCDEGQGELIADSSGNGRDGTIAGATWVAAGERFGALIGAETSLEFDGQTSYVEIPTFSHDFAGPFTFEAIAEPHADPRQTVNGTDWPSVGKVFSFMLEGRASCWIVFNHVGGGWIIRYRDQKIDFISHSREGKLHGVKHHVAGVWTGAKFDWFVNGRESNGALVTSPAKGVIRTSLAAIGREGNPDGISSRRYFRGKFYELRISRGVRYAAPFTPPASFDADADTVLLYHFNEGAGNVLKDSSGNHFDGKIFGATWRHPERPPPPPEGDSTGLSFDGQTDYVEFPSLRPDFRRPFTIEAVVEPDAEPRPPVNGSDWDSVGKVFSVVEKDRSNYWMVFNHVTGGWIVRYRNLETDLTAFSRRDKLHGIRHHVAGVCSGKRFDWYIDGRESNGAFTLERSRRGIGIDNVASIGREDVGGKTSRYFRGKIYAMRISTGAKYQRDFTPPTTFQAEADTLALYQFDEGQGDVLSDSSGNKHHGKIYGATWIGAAR